MRTCAPNYYVPRGGVYEYVRMYLYTYGMCYDVGRYSGIALAHMCVHTCRTFFTSDPKVTDIG